MSSSKAKDFRPIITELQRQGWEVSVTRGSHYRARPPDPKRPIVHFAASVETRALKNTIADLRRSGFEWPPEARQGAPFSQNLLPLSHELAPSGTGSVWETGEGSETEDLDVLPDAAFGSVPGLADEAKPESEEDKMDRLWQELRDARSNYKLAEEIENEARERLTAAQRAMSEASMEKGRAAESLCAAKAEFDKAFEAVA